MRVAPGTTTKPTTARIGLYSFGDKGKVRPSTQFTFDVTKFRDPAGQKQFNGVSNGTHQAVRQWMKEDERVAGIIAHCKLLANDLVKPKTRTNGNRTEIATVSAWLSISFMDHHGRWAAPAITELVADALCDAGYDVVVTHSGLPDNL